AVMDRGVIQQIGTPDEIYSLPENVFVADFLGSPAMNMLLCKTKRVNGQFTAIDDRAGLTFDLAFYRWRQAPEEGQEVKAGFRPEHLGAPEDVADGRRTLRLDLPVQFLEKSGPEAVAFLGLSDATIAMRIDQHAAARLKQGTVTPVVLPLDRLNVFDARSGRRM